MRHRQSSRQARNTPASPASSISWYSGRERIGRGRKQVRTVQTRGGSTPQGMCTAPFSRTCQAMLPLRGRPPRGEAQGSRPPGLMRPPRRAATGPGVRPYTTPAPAPADSAVGRGRHRPQPATDCPSSQAASVAREWRGGGRGEGQWASIGGWVSGEFRPLLRGRAHLPPLFCLPAPMRRQLSLRRLVPGRWRGGRGLALQGSCQNVRRRACILDPCYSKTASAQGDAAGPQPQPRTRVARA